jgi:saccharopine dehydrogenase-like NADP-dependent oxidoreductase
MAIVTVLGAGLVAGPIVRHLLERSDHRVQVAARRIDSAAALVAGHPRGRAVRLEDANEIDALVRESDVVVSMLPYTYHVAVAERCILHRKHLVTTSYVSPAMRALDARAKAAGVVLMNELGLDPGIDHMSAAQVIDAVRRRGGRVTSFRSYCGGLPALEANTNPLGYKFSWSPRGVVLAARNSARYLDRGVEVVVPGPELFAAPEHVEIPGVGSFEGYPNRNSLDYVETYGLTGADTVFRGTLRHVGHCATWKVMADLGLFDDAPRTWSRGTFGGLAADLAGSPGGDAASAVAERLRLGAADKPLRDLAWLGMFEPSPLPANPIAPIDALIARMCERMQYGPGERDMIVLRHEFVACYPDGLRESIRSTLVSFGAPNGDSAMSRTVSLPAAVGALGILDGRFASPGVCVPVAPSVYGPILDELAAMGIAFEEIRRPCE